MTMSRKHENTPAAASRREADHSLHDATLSLLDRAIDTLASDRVTSGAHRSKGTKRIRRRCVAARKSRARQVSSRESGRPHAADAHRHQRHFHVAKDVAEHDGRAAIRGARLKASIDASAGNSIVRTARRPCTPHGRTAQSQRVFPVVAKRRPPRRIGNTIGGRKALAKAKSTTTGAARVSKASQVSSDELELLRAVFGSTPKGCVGKRTGSPHFGR